MRSIALLALAALSLQDDASYFPLSDGARWVYKTREGRFSTKVGEPGPTKDGPKRTVEAAVGKDSATLTTLDGKAPGTVRILVTRDGVYQTGVDPANLILKFPLGKFDDWGPGDKRNGLPRFANHGRREIEVAGKKYLCWKITETRSLPRVTRSWTRWYAPDVGLVWEESTEEVDGVVTQRVAELESYEKAPARK